MKIVKSKANKGWKSDRNEGTYEFYRPTKETYFQGNQAFPLRPFVSLIRCNTSRMAIGKRPSIFLHKNIYFYSCDSRRTNLILIHLYGVKNYYVPFCALENS